MDTKHGHESYSKAALLIYDPFLHGFISKVVWKCPSSNILNLYNQYISGNHLDVGIGTGYFLDKCKFPTKKPRIGLMDLNENCLITCQRRLNRYSPEIYQRNILSPININAPNFDSIGMSYLLHCLPGNMESKTVVFDHLKSLLNPGGIIFGSTFLFKDIKRNFLETQWSIFFNKIGAFNNKEDSYEELREVLKQQFSEYSITMIRCVGLFWARK